MEVCSSTDMDGPVPRIWKWGEPRAQNRPKQTRSVPVNALVATELATSISWPQTGFEEVGGISNGSRLVGM
jgi:hypothetical protein